MILVMAVTLYTSRVILKTLGVSDYGTYNVLGGIIGMLGFFNTILSGSTSRFLTIELGKGDMRSLKNTFSMTNTLCLIAVVFFLFIGETVGLWFVNTHLNIDPARMGAANWVYQCALISASLTVLQTPYTASVIAHEKMSIYAYMSIFDVVMKLLIVFVLQIINEDKLILYSILLLFVTILDIVIYRVYCLRNFEECNFSFYYEKKKFRDILSYSGWNMIIVFANMLNNYGLNILLNIFYGTVVNAARGLALQVSNVANQLYANFQTASRPQIMKYYVQEKKDEMSRLISNTSKFSGYLVLCLIIPVCFNINGLLSIWLEEVPEYTNWFVCIIMLTTFCAAIDGPVGMGIQAVGKMKLPNLTVSMLYIAVFPIGYVAMKLGAGPVISYVVYVVISPLILLADLIILRHYTGFSIRQYMQNAILPIIRVSILSIIPTFFIFRFLRNDSVLTTLSSTVLSFFFVGLVIFFFGISKSTREKTIQKIKGRVPNRVE